MLIVNWDKINELYKAGTTINELSKRFNIKKKTIYYNLKKNYPDSRAINKKNKIIKKKKEKEEAKRLLLKESKHYMGDLEFIKRNRSIYKTDEKTGDIYLNTTCILPADVPRIWRNENNKIYK